MKEKIILIGGGGHCKSCIDVIEQEGRFEIAGIVERPNSSGIPSVLGYPIIGTDDYLRILNKTGWQHTHIIQAPMSAQRFSAVVVSAMQKKRILGVTSRYVIILKQ